MWETTFIETILCLILSFGHILVFFKACNIHESGINMGSVLPPILEDFLLEHILKVILESTFNKVIA